MEKVKVGVVGYGTIGKRVADAVMLQEDMELIGVTGNSYNFRMEMANEKGIKIYTVADDSDFKANDITPAGNFEDLLKAVDIIVDCTPKKIGRSNKENYYVPNKIKAIFQGGEKPDVGEASFVAQCNFKEAVGKDYVRVVSCNTTGLSRTLSAIDKKYGIVDVVATMIRRGADPGDIHHGPINALVPVLEMPSHHGPDVKTVLKDMQIFTTALSGSFTLMHLHSCTVEMKQEVTQQQIIDVLKDTPRVRVVRNAERVRSTAEIMEMAKDLGRNRGDMPEICVWEETIGTHGTKLFFMQAIHQESDVVPENIDCIRAMMNVCSAEESMKKTNESLKLKG